MGSIQDIHSSMMNILNDEIGRPVKIRVPLINSPSTYTTYTTTGLVSAISNNDVGTSGLITLDTVVCKLIKSKLTLITNCPTSDLKKKNVIIQFNANDYTIVKEEPNAFDDMIVLYLNRK